MSPNHNPKYAILVTRLREARKASRLTQAEAGAKMGQSQSFVSKVETNQKTIDPIELLEFARVYQVSITDLLDFS